MTWWLSRGCAGPNAGGFDPYAAPLYECAPPLIWSVPAPVLPVTPLLAPARAVVGHKDCCGSCSSGGVCETSCDSRPRVGQLEAPPLEEEAYPWSTAVEFDKKIETLYADIKKTLAAHPDGTAELAALSQEWGVFYPAWQAWWGQYKNDTIAHLGPITGEKKTRPGGFDDLVKRYAKVLDLAKAAGVETSETPLDTRSPVAKAGDALTQGASDAAAVVGQVLVYTLAAGVVIGGALLAWPYVLPLFGRLRKAA